MQNETKDQGTEQLQKTKQERPSEIDDKRARIIEVLRTFSKSEFEWPRTPR